MIIALRFQAQWDCITIPPLLNDHQVLLVEHVDVVMEMLSCSLCLQCLFHYMQFEQGGKRNQLVTLSETFELHFLPIPKVYPEINTTCHAYISQKGT